MIWIRLKESERSIGVTEMAKYLREEKNMGRRDDGIEMILQASISSIKRLKSSYDVVNEAWMNLFCNHA
ncbi:hypothetical protein H5410_001361 [Solanum commersonii]|uniref:Uncharacterized protein n=1 Tax=Solanum commersonii TaxID=4109 RepID=A0A9J6AYX8_SOLCO|nr:hypothetical protein H5410_001361 [Solanum commersonii]